MYECRYDHIKPKYQENAKQCYIDTDSFIVLQNITNNVKKRFDTSNYAIKTPLPIGKNKKQLD